MCISLKSKIVVTYRKAVFFIAAHSLKHFFAVPNDLPAKKLLAHPHSRPLPQRFARKRQVRPASAEYTLHGNKYNFFCTNQT